MVSARMPSAGGPVSGDATAGCAAGLNRWRAARPRRKGTAEGPCPGKPTTPGGPTTVPAPARAALTAARAARQTNTGSKNEHRVGEAVIAPHVYWRAMLGYRWTWAQVDGLPPWMLHLVVGRATDPDEPGDAAGTREPRQPAPTSPPALLELAAP